MIDKDVKPLVTYHIDHVGRMELAKKSYIIFSLINTITLISISNCTCKPVNCHRRRNRNEIYDFPETLSDHQKLEKKIFETN